MVIKTPIPVKMHPKRKKIVARLLELEADVVFADGFDDAIIGIAAQHTRNPVVVYDREECLKIIMRRDHINRAAAESRFCTDTECEYVGSQTPMFLDRCEA